jgi:hypothetical protein
MGLERVHLLFVCSAALLLLGLGSWSLAFAGDGPGGWWMTLSSYAGFAALSSYGWRRARDRPAPLKVTR